MRPLKLGVIGTGSVVREIYRHLYFDSVYAPLVSVEAICDTCEQSVRAFGDEHGIPAGRRFRDYEDMCAKVELDAVAINTPDSFHRQPVMHALDCGLDVVLPKPLADRICDAHAMIERLRATGRFMGVDFHKREDPMTKEARTRFRNGDYGTPQAAVFYMLDKLMVADPNHVPRFFATTDFAVKNTPVSFLTVHMADTFMFITGLKPVEVKATGYKQKLPSLEPITVDGYDLVDTEVVFEGGGTAHFITGWALPNSACAVTVQSGRIVGSEGMLDLAFDRSGYHEIIADGVIERNPLFMNFEDDGTVSGYGMTSPGRIIENIRRFRAGEMPDDRREVLLSPFDLGFHATIVCDAAHRSLEGGEDIGQGVIRGVPVVVSDLLKQEIGTDCI